MVTKRREQLSDAEKFQVLNQYGLGVPISQIAQSVSRDTKQISKFIQNELKAMNTIKETNVMAAGVPSIIKAHLGKAPTKFLTEKFLDKVEDNAEIYAFYFVQTGDNSFSIIQSGLDVGIHKGMAKSTKDYVYRIRGQFIRALPNIASLIKREQEALLEDQDVQKPYIQRELINQIEQLKIIAAEDPRQRVNLLKAIEMLGKTVTAFTDSVKLEEASAKTGLDILMERVKSEEKTTYAAKDETAD